MWGNDQVGCVELRLMISVVFYDPGPGPGPRRTSSTTTSLVRLCAEEGFSFKWKNNINFGKLPFGEDVRDPDS